MNRGLLNVLTDFLAAISLLVMIATGYILRFPLPPTTNRTHELWGMSRHEWGTIHSWASLGLLAVLFVHVTLHWEWIFSMVRRRFARTKAGPHRRFHAGIVTVSALMITGGLFAWAAHKGVRELKAPLHPLHRPNEAVAIQSDRAAVAPVVDFRRDVMPFFEASCIGCHGPEKQCANFRVDRREDFFASRDAPPLIVPGNSEKSRLMAIVSGEVKEMKSAEAHLLPPREIVLLKAWINAGADWLEIQSTNPSIK